MTPPRRDALHHTYADYFSWPDDERYELIDGIAYFKEPPAPSRSHQEVVGELYHQIRLALKGKRWRAYIAPFDVRLPKGSEPDDLVDTVLQPDVCANSANSTSAECVEPLTGSPKFSLQELPVTTGRSRFQSTSMPAFWKCGSYILLTGHLRFIAAKMNVTGGPLLSS